MQSNPYANEMRKKPTDAERLLWRYLRNRQLGGYKFRRQVPIGRYIADFACWQVRVIVEADGMHHINNAYDRRRDAWLRAQGFLVLRYQNREILYNTQVVLEDVLRYLEQRKQL